jgi:hypothetical protein
MVEENGSNFWHVSTPMFKLVSKRGGYMQENEYIKVDLEGDTKSHMYIDTESSNCPNEMRHDP